MGNNFWDYISHSAKGTHWVSEEHKYIKKIGDRYIYPTVNNVRNIVTGANLPQPTPVKVRIPGPLNNYGVRATEQDARLRAERQQAAARGSGRTTVTARPTNNSPVAPAPAPVTTKPVTTRPSTGGRPLSEKKQQQLDELDRKRKAEEQQRINEEAARQKANNTSSVKPVEQQKETTKAENQQVTQTPAQTNNVTTSSSKSSGKSSSKKSSSKSSSQSTTVNQNVSEPDEIDQIAMDVIRGKYGNGQDRKNALGDSYSIIQERVNAILRGERTFSSEPSAQNQPTTNASSVSNSSTNKLNGAEKVTTDGGKGKPRHINEYTDTGSNKGTDRVRLDGGNKPMNGVEFDARLEALGYDVSKLTEADKLKLWKQMYHSGIRGRSEVIFSDELYHHGIKGQKWGVRRYQNLDGTRTAEGKKQRAMNEGRDFGRTTHKQRKNLSDEELLRRIGRLEKEKKLKELEKAVRNDGHSAVEDILIDSGKQTAKSVITKLGSATLIALGGFYIGKKVNADVNVGGLFKDAIKPKK